MERLRRKVDSISRYLIGWTFLWLLMAGGLIAVGVLVGGTSSIGELVILPGTGGTNGMGGAISPTDPSSVNIRAGGSIFAGCIVQNYPAYWFFTCQMGGSIKWSLATTATSFDMPDLIPASMAPTIAVGFNIVATPSTTPAFTGESYMLKFTFGTGTNKRGISMDPEVSSALADNDWELQQIFFSYIKVKT